MYDIDLLREEVNMEDVCACLSIPVYSGGRTKCIPCPEHQERRHDNCKLYGNRYYCFSCGARGDVFRLVRLTFGVDFRTALKMILSCVPNPQRYEIDGESYDAKKRETSHILGASDLEFLEIRNNVVMRLKETSYSPSRFSEIDGYDTLNRPIYAEFETLMLNPLMALYESDPNSYHHLIMVKARAKMKQLKALKAFILDFDASEKFKKDMCKLIDDDIYRAKRLYVEHGGKILREEKSLLSMSAAGPGALF